MSLERDRKALVRLQLRQGAGGGGDAVAALGVLHRPGAVAEQAFDGIQRVIVARGEDPLAGPPNGERLTARDNLHPGHERGGWTLGRLREQDLDRALEGVLGVLGAERDAAGRAPEVGLGHREHREGPLAPSSGESDVSSVHARDNPRDILAAPS